MIRLQIRERLLATAAASFLALSIVGCSGNGTTVGFGTPLREFVVGDQWVYRQEAISNQEEGTQTTWATETVTVSTEELEGALYRAFDQHFIVDGSEEGNTFTDIFIQDNSTRAVTLIGHVEPDGTKFKIPPTAYLPGTFEPGVTWTTQTGDSPTITSIVRNAEQVTVPAGTFDAYRVDFSTASPEPGGSTVTGTIWFSPELGAPVKQVQNVAGDGFTEVVTLTLQSTNVD